MAEFYAWSPSARLAATLFIALCILSQAMSAILSFYRRRGSFKRIIENALEFAILAHLLVCSMLHGQVMQAASVLLIPATGYIGSRIAVFALLVAILVVLTVIDKTPRYILAIVAAGLSLPLMEPLIGSAFAWACLSSMLFWFVRSIGAAFSHYKEIKSGLSAISIKNAVDSLSTGVMFCEKDGLILLANDKMQQLMMALAGRIQRNGRQFYEQITTGKTQADCKIAWLEDKSVCLVLECAVWNFNTVELHIGRKEYFQLTASDITERWRLTEKLQTKNNELLRRQEELGDMITNVHKITRDREAQKVKIRTHDILSQRLTLLLRSIRNEQELDIKRLRSLSHSLMDDLKAVSRSLPPQEELDDMIATLRSVGVQVMMKGELPGDSSCGRLLAEIIYEAAANSVRHGFATQVCVQIDDRQGTCCLHITDNGYPPTGNFIEGGGISGIREKVRAFGGTVFVSANPRFTLTVTLPASVKCDKNVPSPMSH